MPKGPPKAVAKAVGVPKIPKGGPTKLGGGVAGGNASPLSIGLAAARPAKRPRVGNIATKQTLMRQPGGGI
jgi:hypothetical protein